MCEASIIMTAVGGVFSAVQSMAQGNDQAELSRYNAAVARNDAILAEQRAAIDARNARREKDRLLAQHRASLGKSGIQQQGSPLLVYLDTASKGEENALLSLHSGQVAANAKRQQAQLDLFEAGRRQSQGFAQAGMGLLSTATDVTEKTFTSLAGASSKSTVAATR